MRWAARKAPAISSAAGCGCSPVCVCLWCSTWCSSSWLLSALSTDPNGAAHYPVGHAGRWHCSHGKEDGRHHPAHRHEPRPYRRSAGDALPRCAHCHDTAQHRLYRDPYCGEKHPVRRGTAIHPVRPRRVIPSCAAVWRAARARPASGTSGTTGSPQSMAGQRNTALTSAAVNGAGSGARMAGTMAAFHSRYGADNAGAMQQVRQAISINADDWEAESYTGSSVVQNSTSQTVSGTGSRVMPPAPPCVPLPADFGRMSPPETAGSKLPPVMPSRTADGQVSHMVSPVSPQHMPRSPEQALQDFAGRSPAPEPGGDAASAPGRGTTQADRARQSGKISPVMPPSPRQGAAKPDWSGKPYSYIEYRAGRFTPR